MGSSRPALATVAVALVLTACSGGSTPAQPELKGAPSTPEYVSAQARDLPPGLQRCDYTGPVAAYLDNIEALSADARTTIEGTWTELQQAGGQDAFVAVYAETPDECTTWVSGNEQGIHVQGGSRIVSTVVVRFGDTATAEAAYHADIFKQSLLSGTNGYQVVSGPDTGLGPNAVVGAQETSNPAIHQAVWQGEVFNVFFTSRGLTNTEVATATAMEHDRIDDW